MTTKRLYITASNSYDSDKNIVPINTGKPVSIDSPIGKFEVEINIKNFDGAKPHLSNSYYNQNSSSLLIDDTARVTNPDVDNLVVKVYFTPSADLVSSSVIFGNDATYPIKEHIPVTLLSTGLKFFTWFINKTIKADINSNKPYLYGLAINSFTYVSKDWSDSLKEVLDDSIPSTSAERVKYFTNTKHSDDYTFTKGEKHLLQFNTSFVKMLDSKYAVSIPSFGSKTFDIDVSNYANDKLNNFNWVVKKDGTNGVGEGELGLIINFALRDEDDEESEVD